MKNSVETQITVALVGQPNVGKSTVFNMLTGLSQHVGNWPGKTVEQKIGKIIHNQKNIRLVDLPGTYSLTANTEEERITRDFIIHERPNVVVALVNAAALERSLYLITELLALPVVLVIGLNMIDVAEQRGIHVEPHVLEAAMGVPVVPLIASRNQGLRELMQAVERVVDQPAFAQSRPTIREEHSAVLDELQSLLASQMLEPYPVYWVALKLLEGDTGMIKMVSERLPEAWSSIHDLLLQHEDAYLDIAGGRYDWITRMVRAAVIRPKVGVITLTDRIDRIATHPLWGLALLLAIFGLVFWLTYTVATPFVEWLDVAMISPLAGSVDSVLAGMPTWFSGLVVDGLIGGVGTVLTFLPILIVFFTVLGVLEDVGYLTRAAYVMDRFMHWMGLHGKSFLPLFLGFGCNVPAVLGTRIIEERRARLLTILLAPLVPCTARLAVVAFLAPAFFGGAAVLVSWGLVSVNILVLVTIGILVNRLAFRGAHLAFIMEIPLYHLPNLRTIAMFVWNSTLSFIKKAGSIIVVFSMFVWVLSVFPGKGVENSLLAGLGYWLAPIGRLAGLYDWRLMVALLTSFVAKENTIATLGILYGASGQAGGLAEQVTATLSPAGGLAFLVIQMLFIPCVATMAMIKQETASWKWTGFSVALLSIISLSSGIAVYQVARLWGLGL
jgi:ferrous iron transport protein B